MDEYLDDPPSPGRRKRIIERLDQMVASGRVTPTEAAKLRSAALPSEFNATILEIRVRHAGTRLTAAVQEGQMTREEADAYLEQMKDGEHPRSLRAHLRRLLPGARNPERESGAGRRPEHGEDSSGATS